METFFGLLAGNTLTRLVFFPAVAAMPLFFFARAEARAAKIYVLVASLIELAFGVLYLASHLAAGRPSRWSTTSGPAAPRSPGSRASASITTSPWTASRCRW